MVTITEDSFTRNVAPLEALDLSEKWYNDNPVINIILKFRPEARTVVVDSFNEEQIQFCVDGTIQVHFTAPEDNWLIGLILGFGSQVEVMELLSLRKRIRQKAYEISNI